MPDADGLLTFPEFREAVGYPEWRVRAALLALNIQPERSRVDLRTTWYRPEWVEQVRDWIEGKGQSNQ